MVTCAVRNQQFEMIHYNHLKTHGLTVKEYKKLYYTVTHIRLFKIGKANSIREIKISKELSKRFKLHIFAS